MNFQSFNLKPAVSVGVTRAGFVTPTPIQKEAIPPVMAGRDVIGVAQTGTGKTAVFALPILNRLVSGIRGQARALIIAPTRELAEQIHSDIETLGAKTGLRSVSIYGGVGINPQIQKLKRADIIVACPGRLLDHINRRTVNLSRLEVLVLDEADHMFDMGFLPDIRRILKNLPARRQTLLFSATMPVEIRRLAGEVLTHPVSVKVGNTAPADTVSHAVFPVSQHLKTPLLLRLLKKAGEGSVLVFTRTKHRAKKLDEQLARAGYRSASLQGNLSQNRRQAALDGFRGGKYQILVATDIAARGIDVSRVSCVINYDIPNTTDAYIHRIGRTGRAERSGEAFTLVTNEDKIMLRAIDRAVGFSIERRSLDDFDYGAPAPRKNNADRRQPRRKPSQPGNGGHRKSVFGPIVTTRPKFSSSQRNARSHA